MSSRAALIIDDEKDICFLLGKVLSEKKYNVSIANNLTDGLKKIRNENPTILFLDIRLPDGSGLDAISEIKKYNPHIKIIVMSAFDETQERLRATELGADLFIGKPLNMDLINHNLKNIESNLT